MTALSSRCEHYIFLYMWFLLLFSIFFPRLISAVVDWMSTILLHVALIRANLECKSEMCYTWLAGNTGCKNDAKNCHLRTIAQLCRAVSSQLRYVSTIGKKVLNRNMSSTCPHNMANFGSLTPEMGSGVWGTPQISTGFASMSSLLHAAASFTGGQPNCARCLAVSWAAWYTMSTFLGIFYAPDSQTEFSPMQNSL